MANCRTVKLNSGFDCPLLGYGTWQSTDEQALKDGVKAAISAGYRHIDTAFAYQNEAIIGEALQDMISAGTVKREELFITTKILPCFLEPAKIPDILKMQLGLLKLDYVDLYLIHFPTQMKASEPGSALPFVMEDGKAVADMTYSLEESWKGMEKCVELGLAKSIGISNFNISQVDRLCKSKIKPAMNQVEMHPLFQNKKLLDHCKKVGVTVTAYSAFGSPGSKDPQGNLVMSTSVLEHNKLVSIGKKYEKSSSHVILKWLTQQGIVVIPKSLTPSRIQDNFKIWDFQLSDDELKTIASLDENKRVINKGQWLPGLVEHPEFPFTMDWKSC